MTMEKVYNPLDIEASTYKWWEEHQCFAPSGKGPSFSMVIPPPNVTGALHMGHALNLTIQDVVVRYKRLNGYNVLWVPGTDHAGIATQNVVEKSLKEQGVSRHDLGRDPFLEKVWDWKAEYGGRITTQIRAMGASVDWGHERFTMDEGCQKAVLEHFVSLYNKGYIYRGKRIINWCPRCHTALSDIEVEFNDKNGHLWHIQYTAEDGTSIVVATTRPETMFGDTAVAVHPDDERYQHLIGSLVTIPLANRAIPIVADTHVDKDFGSGAVKVTPAHDPNDFEIGERHQLEKLLIMDESGVMNQNVPEAYQGLDRYACRKQLIIDLDGLGVLVKTDDHLHAVGACYRCHTVIEPYLSNQWFVAMSELVKPAIDAVRRKDVTFTPDRWEKLYFDWMENIRDWCISRQIWWGHQIPVWYKGDEIYCGVDAPEGDGWERDPDVLDTWFSSSLWPFSTLGWPEKTTNLETYYPTSLLVTGYDIITFWVSRMITMGLEEMGQVPFNDVYIHGLVRDVKGRKMSKSLGNAVDPMVLINEYGADALRFSLASLSTLGGQDITFSEEKVQASRNFANKIWNITRYILMNLDESDTVLEIGVMPRPNNLVDEWIISSFYSMLEKVDMEMNRYNFAAVADELWNFIWNQFCDWYIEATKVNRQESLPLLVTLLTHIIVVMHPLMPFVTEQLWQTLKQHPKLKFGHSADTVSLLEWPVVNKAVIQPEVEANMSTLIDVIRDIRHVRKSMGIPESKQPSVTLLSSDKDRVGLFNDNLDLVVRLAHLESLVAVDAMPDLPEQRASSVVQGCEWFMPLEGMIDLDAERQRLEGQLSALTTDLEFNQKKLSNSNFVEKAPEKVVAGIREKVQELESEQQLVRQQLDRLGAS